MSGVTGLAALDVAIGLFLLFFLLSIVCSTVNELIAGALGWRAKNLELAVRNLLGEPGHAERFWNNPRIRALEQPRRRRRTPSYIPARVFALVALDTFAPDLAERAKATDPASPDSQDLVGGLGTAVAKIPIDPIRMPLEDALAEGRTSIDELRARLERTFDDVMDRASGWYKRRVQLALLVIAAVVTIAGNVDAAQVAGRLWQDDALRAAVVQRAGAAAAEQPPATSGDLETLAANVGAVEDLGLPLGWGDATTPDSLAGWLGKLALGWPATIFALALGAPFWFDLLGKVAQLRTAGNREGTVKDDSRRAEDRDEPRR